MICSNENAIPQGREALNDSDKCDTKNNSNSEAESGTLTVIGNLLKRKRDKMCILKTPLDEIDDKIRALKAKRTEYKNSIRDSMEKMIRSEKNLACLYRLCNICDEQLEIYIPIVKALRRVISWLEIIFSNDDECKDALLENHPEIVSQIKSTFKRPCYETSIFRFSTGYYACGQSDPPSLKFDYIDGIEADSMIGRKIAIEEAKSRAYCHVVEDGDSDGCMNTARVPLPCMKLVKNDRRN